MELLLNIIWLALCLSAVWAWHTKRTCRVRYSCQEFRGFLLLACALMLLFPVVSATDDLHPMRAELEESSPFKRTVKQGAGNNLQISLLGLGFLVFSIPAVRTTPYRELIAIVSIHSSSLTQDVASRNRSPRAPPCCA